MSEEKKLTDEEIVKAIDKCFAIPMKCEDGCPYFNKDGRNFCVENNAFYKDLKRIVTEHAEQKAEIERLSIKVWNYEQPARTPLYNNESMVNCNLVTCYNENADLKAKNAELQKQIDEQENEIDRLEKVVHEQAEQYYDCEQRTAKEILQAVDNESCGQTECITNRIRRRYGVEVE